MTAPTRAALADRLERIATSLGYWNNATDAADVRAAAAALLREAEPVFPDPDTFRDRETLCGGELDSEPAAPLPDMGWAVGEPLTPAQFAWVRAARERPALDREAAATLRHIAFLTTRNDVWAYVTSEEYLAILTRLEADRG
jgi:hypothetical protein